MRCNNCGYDNPSDKVNCVKCNAPLMSNKDIMSELQSAPFEENINKTMQGKKVEAAAWECPKCGRPVVPGADSCNYCNYVFTSDNKDETKNYKNKASAVLGTIDPYQKGFILKPVATQYENDFEEIKFRLRDENIKLGRENLEKTNTTISTEQAEIVMKNGKWYIKNNSDKMSTFVLASDYIELNDGDTILLGDRKFIFKR